MPFNIGPGELILILAIALLVLGPSKLPDVAKALGESVREFRKATTDVAEAVKIEPAPGVPTAQPTPPAAEATPPPPPVEATVITRQPDVTAMAAPIAPAPAPPVAAVPPPAEPASTPAPAPAGPASAAPEADRDSSAG